MSQLVENKRQATFLIGTKPHFRGVLKDHRSPYRADSNKVTGNPPPQGITPGKSPTSKQNSLNAAAPGSRCGPNPSSPRPPGSPRSAKGRALSNDRYGYPLCVEQGDVRSGITTTSSSFTADGRGLSSAMCLREGYALAASASWRRNCAASTRCLATLREPRKITGTSLA